MIITGALNNTMAPRMRSDPPKIDDSDPSQPSYIVSARGPRSWLLSCDHKRIAVLYFVAVLGFFLLGGALGLALHVENWSPEASMDALVYNRLFTLHGVIMMYLFLLPSVYTTLGMFVLPLMVGAANVAFPRLNLGAFYLYLLGGATVMAGSILGRLDSGWTFYTPYSTAAPMAVPVVVLGVLFIAASLFLTSVNFLVTVHRRRPQVLPRGHVPHFVWALYATALTHVLSLPLIGSSVLTLGVEHVLGGLMPRGTGDPYPFQQFIGFCTQLMTYMAVTPALGVVFELVSVHGRINIFRHRAMAFALILPPVLALSADLLETLYTSDWWRIGLRGLAVVPVAIAVRFWLAAVYKGGMQYTSVGWYASFIIVMSALNAATAWVPRRHMTIDTSLSDTHFVVGVFHYTVAAYCVTALLAGLHHWWPKLTGKLFQDRAAKVGSILVFVGFSVACFFEIVWVRLLLDDGWPDSWNDAQVGLTA